MMRFFSPARERHGALANTKSPATRFKGNDISALLLLLFKRFSAVSQTKFVFGFFFRNFRISLKKSMIKIPQYLKHLM
jgi:hypothetical protein